MENKSFTTFELITPEVKKEEKEKEKGLIHCCPHCGVSHYSVGATMGTALGYELIMKDGKIINEDPNTYTTACFCLNCHKDFSIVRKGNSYEIYK
jgi:hypothetical protein